MAYTFKHGDRPLEGITVQRAVGRGGFGEVYYAVTDSGKQIALKYLRENPEIELRGIAHVINLKSPYLITIYDVKRNPADEPFVVMEYVSGPSLREMLIAEPEGMSPQKVAFIFQGIAKGLSYLHERGIVHRDLKPGNIFYDDGYVKIGDYGLSKHMTVSKHSGQTVSVGTVHYMAPEIGSGRYTKAIDIYALGVILYEMLTGRLPFSGSSMAEILMRHLRDNPDLSGIPAPFAPIIAKALAKDPNDRYQDADEMLAAVTESGELGAGIDSFDASSITQVPRQVLASDADQTITSPAPPLPPVPPLDVRDLPPRQELPERMQRRLNQLGRKLEHKAARLERKLGARRGHRPQPDRHRDAAAHPARRAQLFVLIAVAVAIATMLALLHGGDVAEKTFVFSLLIAGSVFAPLLVHLKFLQRMVTRHTFIDRLAYASAAGLCMLPAYGFAVEELHASSLATIIIAPMAAMVMCNWSQRIETGRSGKVDGWSAFWPAVVGFIAASIADAEEYAFAAAGVCAAVSLLTQATASMWPLYRRVAVGQGLKNRAVPIAPTAEPQPKPGILVTPADDEPGVPVGEPITPAPTPEPQPAPPWRTMEPTESARPSFAGRTANAGVAFLGKILLLVGLVLALGQGALLDQMHSAQNLMTELPPELRPLVEHGIPAGVVLVVLALGSFLLVAARRRDGGWHFFRGCIGCALTLLAAFVAVCRGGPALKLLFENPDLSVMNDGDMWADLIVIGITLALGLLFLLWPKAELRRTDKTIVI